MFRKNKVAILSAIIHATLFVWLFYKQQLGFNLFIYELAGIAILWFVQNQRPVLWPSKIVLLGTLLSGLAMIINYSLLAIIINIGSYYLYIGSVVYPEARSLLTTALLSITNSFQSFGAFSAKISELKSHIKWLKWLLGFLKIVFIPVLILIIFINIYNASNPIFNKGLLNIAAFLDEHFNSLFAKIDFGILITFFIGFLFSTVTFFHVKNKLVVAHDQSSSDKLFRKRIAGINPKTGSLKSELKSGLFLLLALNLLILIINVIDIYWVWFNFEWEGEYLKQFVHEGTYMLIFSIIISMAIVLYFFRGNQNFYSKNRSLKILSYVWLGQNALLAVSVAIRNYWYISYFSLAYKRIAVLFFLLLTLYGIFTVIQKVKFQKTMYYLWRLNLMALFCILVFTTFFNWDVIIAQYNFKHYKQSFVHFDFIASLSYKALPVLDKDLDELREIENLQKQLFPFEEQFMSADLYHEKIAIKREEFMTNWNKKNLRSWNFAEANAYKKLNVVGK